MVGGREARPEYNYVYLISDVVNRYFMKENRAKRARDMGETEKKIWGWYSDRIRRFLWFSCHIFFTFSY
jgi:hypothetical protein